MKDFIIVLSLVYTYLLPLFIWCCMQLYMSEYRYRIGFTNLLTLISSIGVIIVTYIEAVYIDNNGLSGNDLIMKYIIWSTATYLIYLWQYYLIRKSKAKDMMRSST